MVIRRTAVEVHRVVEVDNRKSNRKGRIVISEQGPDVELKPPV